jgi:hypothetical protein
MGRRRFVGWSGVVAGLGLAVASVTPVPASAAPRSIWSGAGPVPADLVQEPEPDIGTNIDAGARNFADVDHPGTAGTDGCAPVTVDPGANVGFFIPNGETLPTRFTDGVLCTLRVGAQELRLTGFTYDPADQTHLGWADARFFRVDPSAAFSRFDLSLTDGRCFAVGSQSGYPGDGTTPDDYVVQGWNYAADPTVDCRSRSTAPPLGPDDLPQLWGAAHPADLVEVTPSGSPVTDEYLDMAAGLWVDPNEVPGPPDADGCGALTLLATTALIPWFDPLGTASGNAPATYDAARLCAGPDGAGTILELTGHTDHDGPLRTYFARPAVDRSWHSTAVEYGPQHCYVYAPVGGFPAPAGDADYLLQAWNLGDDPSVDCSDRTAPPPTTSTTTPTPTTTTAVGQVPTAPPADAQPGRASFAG